MKRILIIAAVVVVLVVVVWDQRRRAPEVQVPLTFARMAEAVADHDAAGIMVCVDRSYDFTGKWPAIFPVADQARSKAQQYLAMAFLHQGQQVTTMTWTLDHMETKADGSVVVDVSLKVAGGMFDAAIPALSHHQFTLVRGSLLTGRYRIRDHAPFALNIPELN